MSILLNKSSNKFFGLDPTKQAALEVRRVFEVISPPSRLQIGILHYQGRTNRLQKLLGDGDNGVQKRIRTKAQAKKELSKTQAKQDKARLGASQR